MSSNSGLAAPGSSVYSSGTMYVGDGTWDASRNSFLLPNIQGLNFATMRYNGMGNRFRALNGYHSIIVAHGVLAAITFLVIVPTAILMARFYWRNPPLAMRTHITLQILTVIFTTIIFLLGYFAVGPSRSLTNPHHGIGVALFVLVLVQAIGGAIIRRIEKGKTSYYKPLKLMLHQWFGRAIALLGIAQIPIGLTLYGSPAYLFVLYTLATAFLVGLLFVLTFQRYKRYGLAAHDDGESYATGTQTDFTQRSDRPWFRTRLGQAGAAVAGVTGVAALRRRMSDRGRRQDDDRRTDVSGHSRVDSSSYLTEKYDDGDEGGRDYTWRDRILAAAGGAGAAVGLNRLLGRRNNDRSRVRDDDRPPLGGQVESSMDPYDRVEAGMPAYEANAHSQQVEDHERRQAAAAGQSDHDAESIGEYSTEGGRDDDDDHEGGKLAGVAGAVGLGGWLERRRSKKEQQRRDAQQQQQAEEDRLYQPAEQQPLYPGNGTPRRDGGVRFDPNLPGSSVANQSQQQPGPAGFNQPPPPPTNAIYTQTPYGPQPPPQNIPPPPMGGVLRGTPPQNIPPPPMGGPNRGTPPYVRMPSLPQTTRPTGSPGRPMSPAGPSGGPLPPPPPAHSSGLNSPTRNSPNRGPIMLGPAPQQPLPVASPPRPQNQRNSENDSYSSNSEIPIATLRVKPHRDGRHIEVQQVDARGQRGRRQSGTDAGPAGGGIHIYNQPQSARPSGQVQPQMQSQAQPGVSGQNRDSAGSAPAFNNGATQAGTGVSELHLPSPPRPQAPQAQSYPTQQPQQQPFHPYQPRPSQQTPSRVPINPQTQTNPAMAAMASPPSASGTGPAGYGPSGGESYDERRRRRRAERARQSSARLPGVGQGQASGGAGGGGGGGGGGFE